MAFYLSSEFEALKHDINTLFSNFHEKQSVRFEDFCEQWKSLNFSCIFGATSRNTVTAKMRIVERLFRVISEFLSEESTFLYRVAAVYSFYAVYFKQITPTKVKIRMTPAMWTDLMKFVEILQENQHYDVVYIIQVLRKHKAFSFTAFPKELCFGRFEFMIGVESFGGYKNLLERNYHVNEVMNENNGVLPKIRQIQNDYDDIKQKLLLESKEEEKDELKKVLFYSNSQFPDDISKIITSHKRKYKDESSALTSNETIQRPKFSQLNDLKTQDETITEVKKETRANTISKLKDRIWSAEIKHGSSSRYHVETSKDAQSEKEVEPEKSLYKKSAMLQVKAKQASTGPRKKKEIVKFKIVESDNILD